MKRNVNVFIAVVLCAVLCGGIIWLQTAADEEKLGWNVHDLYGDAPAYSNGAAYTNATFAGPSNGGGVMSLSSSRALRRSAAAFSYAGAYSGAVTQSLTSNLSPLTSSAPVGGGLYTTSSQTIKSYGGGGNGGAMGGGAMSANRSNSASSNPSLQGGIGFGVSPIAYSTARRGTMSSVSGDELMAMPAENPVMAMASAANAGMTSSFYGAYSAMDYSSADYGQYAGMFGGSRSNVRGRQNAPGTGVSSSSWQTWLRDVWLPSQGVWGTQGEDGNWYITEAQLRAAYDAFMAGWNNDFDGPTYADWKAWFDPYGYGDGLGVGDKTYYWLPVGDILPLLLIALLYMLVIFLQSTSLQKVNNNKKLN